MRLLVSIEAQRSLSRAAPLSAEHMMGYPLRTIREMVDEVLSRLSRRFDTMYAKVGRPSIAPEKLLRAQLLQMLYSIRSERLLMEAMDYNLLFRWFVGLNGSPRTATACWKPT